MIKFYVLSSLLFLSLSCASSNKGVGLKIGAKAPDVSLTSTDGKVFNFSKQTKDTVAVFYRGSW